MKSRISEPALRAAIAASFGNLTRAAKILEISKVHVMRLVAQHSLREYALEIRLAAGHPATGHPKTVTST